MIQYVEPHPCGGTCLVTLTEEQAIEWQKKAAAHAGYVYKSDEEALDDFMVVHWARKVEE